MGNNIGERTIYDSGLSGCRVIIIIKGIPELYLIYRFIITNLKSKISLCPDIEFFDKTVTVTRLPLTVVDFKPNVDLYPTITNIIQKLSILMSLICPYIQVG